MKTWNAKTENVERTWWIVDATNVPLGRLAGKIARTLTGKNKPIYTPNADTGDFVVVVNAEKIALTGDKWNQKKYYRHSRYFGSLKEFTAAEMIERDPTFLVEDAVKGMLPKNKMARHLLLKMKAYAGPNHPHANQKPQALK